ncbi:10052_t:CDS:2, partial [Dentiscutata heterogama]
WALKENQKLTQHEPTKKITEEIKSLLEIMFHTAHSEIEADNIPKITTIANWISEFFKKWKAAMAMRSIEEAETSEALNMTSFSK